MTARRSCLNKSCYSQAVGPLGMATLHAFGFQELRRQLDVRLDLKSLLCQGTHLLSLAERGTWVMVLKRHGKGSLFNPISSHLILPQFCLICFFGNDEDLPPTPPYPTPLQTPHSKAPHSEPTHPPIHQPIHPPARQPTKTHIYIYAHM